MYKKIKNFYLNFYISIFIFFLLFTPSIFNLDKIIPVITVLIYFSFNIEKLFKFEDQYKGYIFLVIVLFIFFTFKNYILYKDTNLVILLSFKVIFMILFILSFFNEIKKNYFNENLKYIFYFLCSQIGVILFFKLVYYFDLFYSNLNIHHIETYYRLDRSHSLNYGGSSLSLIFTFANLMCIFFHVLDKFKNKFFILSCLTFFICAFFTGRTGSILILMQIFFYILYLFYIRKLLKFSLDIDKILIFIPIIIFLIFVLRNEIFWVELEIFNITNSPSFKELFIDFDEINKLSMSEILFGFNEIKSIDGGYAYFLNHYGILFSFIWLNVIPIVIFHSLKKIKIKIFFLVFSVIYGISSIKLAIFFHDTKLLIFIVLFVMTLIKIDNWDKVYDK